MFSTVRPDETVQRILSVDFCELPSSDPVLSKTWSYLISVSDCLNRDDFDYELHKEIDPYHVDHGPPHRYEHTLGVDTHDATVEHPCSELKKILSGGTFYYSLTFDLTNRLQDRYVECIISRARKSYSHLDCQSSQHSISIT